MDLIYFDHGATTPVRSEVWEAMQPFFTSYFGNPSSLHMFGESAANALNKSREMVAKAIGASPSEIIFTSGGTEANNLAIQGIVRHYGRERNQIVVSSIEHDSVRSQCKELEQMGFEVIYLPVDKEGRVYTNQLANVLSHRTLLVSIMHANNEVGTIQPIEEIGAVIRAWRQQNQAKNRKMPFFHCDAVQSFGKIPIDVSRLGVDLLTISGHKIYGPKGSGVLYLKNNVRLSPLLYGGGQEKELRSGTQNVPAIVGMAKAAQLAVSELTAEGQRLIQLRERFISGIIKIHGASLTGHPTERLPHNIHFRIEGIEGQAIMLELSRRGIAVSTGSACHAGFQDPSHVMLAMGYSEDQAYQGVRITLGRSTTVEQIDYAVTQLEKLVMKFRAMEVLPNYDIG